jgi:hypothetical protein
MGQEAGRWYALLYENETKNRRFIFVYQEIKAALKMAELLVIGCPI